MEHMQFLLVRAEDNEADVSGHALMQTCPPHSHIAENPEEKYPHKMPDVSQPDLMKLLDLSHRLPTMEGEITPVMAWVAVRKEPRFQELSKEDIEALKGDLLAKVRCYGYVYLSEPFSGDVLILACANTFSQLRCRYRGIRGSGRTQQHSGYKRSHQRRRPGA